MMVTIAMMVVMVVMVNVVMVAIVTVTWAMARSCPRVPSGPGQTDRLEGRSLPSDPDPSDMLKYKHHNTAGRGSGTQEYI